MTGREGAIGAALGNLRAIPPATRCELVRDLHPDNPNPSAVAQNSLVRQSWPRSSAALPLALPLFFPPVFVAPNPLADIVLTTASQLSCI